MDGLLSLVIAVIVVALIAYICFWLLARIPLPEPVRVVLTVLVALVLLVAFVQRFGLLSGF